MSGSVFVMRAGPSENSCDDDALAVFASRTGFPVLRDRFGFLNAFSRWRLMDGSISFPSSGSTANFADLMDKRAVEILNLVRNEGKELHIFLSGGVDSTAMTIAMLKASDGDFRNLHVVFNSSTEEEYPEFVEYLKTTGIDMVRCRSTDIDDVQERLLETGYTLTGWAADQLFGSIINQVWPDWYFKDWREWLLSEEKTVPMDTAIGQFEETFANYGMPIKIFGEFAWFMNFSTKYNVVVNSDVLYSGKVTHRMISFYDTPEFNEWSVSNFDVLHRYPQHDAVHYKTSLKDYIYTFNHDETYRNGKGKIGSWGRAKYREKVKVHPRICLMESPDKVVFRREGKLLPIEKSLEVERTLTRNILRLYRKQV